MERYTMIAFILSNMLPIEIESATLVRIAKVIDGRLKQQEELDEAISLPAWEFLKALEKEDPVLYEFLAYTSFAFQPHRMFTHDQIAALRQFRDFQREFGLSDSDREGEYLREVGNES